VSSNNHNKQQHDVNYVIIFKYFSTSRFNIHFISQDMRKTRQFNHQSKQALALNSVFIPHTAIHRNAIIKQPTSLQALITPLLHLLTTATDKGTIQLIMQSIKKKLINTHRIWHSCTFQTSNT